jgi:hypothetical protein
MTSSLNLRVAWEQCMAMWLYIVRVYPHTNMGVNALKEKWLEERDIPNHYTSCVPSAHSVKFNCFLCEYAIQHCKSDQVGISQGEPMTGCAHCPARLVNPSFSCYNEEYRFSTKPHEFYKILKRHYKLYLSERGGE